MTNDTSEPEEHELPKDGTEPSLSRRQILALPILAAAPNLTQGAKDACIGEATLRRWRRDKHFRAEMDRLTNEIAETTKQAMKDIVQKGFRTVGELMEDPDPMVRFRAAQAAIIYGIQVCNAEELRKKEEKIKEARQDRTDEGKDRGTQTG